MEFSLEDNRAGAGSSVLLSPEIVAIRTKLIEACDGKTFADTIEFLKQLLDKEEDEQKRLGILAARVLVLRQRVSHIQDKEDASDMSQFVALTQSVVDDDEKDTEDEADASDDESWIRVRITENSIVKGVRFPKGVIVDVHHEEADALIEAGKAEVIESSEEKNDAEAEAEAEVEAVANTEVETEAEEMRWQILKQKQKQRQKQMRWQILKQKLMRNQIQKINLHRKKKKKEKLLS